MFVGLSSFDHIFVVKAGAAEKVAHSVPRIFKVEKPLNLAIMFCSVEKVLLGLTTANLVHSSCGRKKLWDLPDDSCGRLAGVEICFRTGKEIKKVANLRFLIVYCL
jgi:hypothetical protein